MTAVGRLQAAIEKLQHYRIGGEWLADVPGINGGQVVVVGGDGLKSWVADVIDEATTELVVILHRTIEAQLAILRAALIEHTDVMTSIEQPYWDAALALADAILGSES